MTKSDVLAMRDVDLKIDLPTEGIYLISASGIEETEKKGAFKLTDFDPQAVFRLDEENCRSFFLKIEFIVNGFECKSKNPRIYIDFADNGFDQSNSFSMSLQHDGRYRAIVAFGCFCPRIRWDPSEAPGSIEITKIVATIIDSKLDGEQLFGKNFLTPTAEEKKAWASRAFAVMADINRKQLNAKTEINLSYSDWVRDIELSPTLYSNSSNDFLVSVDEKTKFSFVVPTYNTPVDLLTSCVQSLQSQTYSNFEICIADDNSANPEVKATLKRLAEEDARIKIYFRERNGHISEATNSAVALASGDFIVLVDHDDIIPKYALQIVAHSISKNPTGKIFYSDEDKLDSSGDRVDPYFKSDFNRFLMFGHNMVSHLGIYNRELVNSVGGFRKGYEGSQDYDLFLRCLAASSDKEVIHIPHVLYHWRMIPGSTSVSADQKSYAIVAAQKALNDFMQQQNLPFRSVDGITAGISAIEVTDAVSETSVSIVIPTRDRLDLLVPCIDSLQGQTGKQVEIIIVDNGSTEPETLRYFDELRLDPFIRVIEAPGEFNFSTICNIGVAASEGEIVCLLNNDTELVSPQWLTRARAFLSVPDVGIVGARLLYPDQTVQHFGLYLGMGGHGVAGTPHRGQPSSEFGPFGKARLVQEFSAVTAACMFIKRSVYDQVGGFDPELRVAYNDVDFCLKVRALGLKVVCDPDIVLIHKESKSRGADTGSSSGERLEKEAALMRERWGPVLSNDPYYNPNLTLERDDFSLAAVPRVTFPWQKTDD